MRITGGKARGLIIKVPKEKVRPATDKMRLAVFSSIGRAIEGKQVLDLFAGSGSYGLEALSRGASSTTFVEKDRYCHGIIKNNLQHISKNLPEDNNSKNRVICKDVFKLSFVSELQDNHFDYIFADMPYMLLEKQASLLFSQVKKWLTLSPESYFILEASGTFDYQTDSWTLKKHLGKKGKKNEPSVLFFQYLQTENPSE